MFVPSGANTTIDKSRGISSPSDRAATTSDKTCASEYASTAVGRFGPLSSARQQSMCASCSM